MTARTVATPPVVLGDRVAVVAPSGPSDSAAIATGIAWLRQRFVIDDDPRRDARAGFLAGSDEDRAAALVDAVRDPSVRAVFATRGGYGAMRVLERAGEALLEALARDPKPVVGFSDITALHAVWGRAGVRSVHGAMVAAIGRGTVSDADRDALVEVLAGVAPGPWTGLDVWRAGEAEGRAAGGNLALLAAMQGTPFAPSFADTVLFLEDVGERPYRLDRMLTQLRLAGALRGVRAIVLGDFTDCAPAADGVSAHDVLRERLCDLGVPVLAGAPFGHDTRQRVIAFGDVARVRSDGTVRFAPQPDRGELAPSGAV